MINSEEAKTYRLISDMYKKGYISKDSRRPPIPASKVSRREIGRLHRPNNFAAIFKDQPPEFEWKLGPILKDKEQATFGTTGFTSFRETAKQGTGGRVHQIVDQQREHEPILAKWPVTFLLGNRPPDLYKGDPVMEMLVEQSKLTRPGVLRSGPPDHSRGESQLSTGDDRQGIGGSSLVGAGKKHPADH